jgi:hypothetical protein
MDDGVNGRENGYTIHRVARSRSGVPQKYRSSFFDDPAAGPFEQVDESVLASIKSLFFPLLNAADRSGRRKKAPSGAVWS